MNHFESKPISYFNEKFHLYKSQIDFIVAYADKLINEKKYDTAFSIISDFLKTYIHSENEVLFNKYRHLYSLQQICRENDYSIDSKFTFYNPEKINEITIKNKQKNRHYITFTMTTCKRIDLFKRTMDSFINCCEDIDMIDRFIVVDDNSSEEDRKEMKTLYPFIDFFWKSPEEKGHAKSLNMIIQLVKTPYIFNIEDDWEFFIKDTYIRKCLDVLESNPKYGQCLINVNYAEISVDYTVVGGILNNTINGIRYMVHEHYSGQELEEFYKRKQGLSSVYWPHFSLRPGLNSTYIWRKFGPFNEEYPTFENMFAIKYNDAGYKTTFLDNISSKHIGRTTYEAKMGIGNNAYEINDQKYMIVANK